MNEHTEQTPAAGELATVHHLPTAQGAAIEGEIITDEEYQRLTSQKARALARYAGYRHDVAVAARTARKVATHEATTTAARAVVRHTCYPFAGAWVICRRVWEAKTNSRYERMLRAAEVANNWELLQEWETRAEQARERRHRRRMDWLDAPGKLVKAVIMGSGALVAALLALGIVLAVANHDIADVLGPIKALIDLVQWVAWVITVSWTPLVAVAPWAILIALWNIGRKHTTPMAWAAPASERDGREMVPDEGAILNALRNLNLAPLNRKIKEGWQPRWVQGTGRDGKGWRTQLELPAGVTVEMINDKRNVLAHNLVRLPVEVWPTEPKNQPGVLDLWVADQGILSGPVDPHPLLTEGTADYFKGVPVGIDQRGQEVIGRLMASNYAAAGIMGSGKTSLVHNILCGAMLDPVVDIEVYVMAFNADYDAMAPVLARFVKGDENEQVEQAIEALRNLRTEVTERGKILSAMGGDETKLTREIAERNPRMRPKVVVFDECQEMFRHEKYGEQAKELAIKVMMKARKCGITLIFVTPAPSADSLPRDLAKTVSHRVCFAIGDHQGNDAILGTGAHKQGITATTLVAGEDIGTAMASGFATRPGLLRTHHIRKDKSVDEITPFVQRAIAAREKAGLPKVVESTPAPVEVDPLADIAAILGAATRMRTQEVLQRLTERDRGTYGEWTPQRLTAFLTPLGAAPYKTGGAMQVSAERVREALTERDELAALAGDEGEGDE
ncbi:FtsK/SpoIIIE domain-containing protein [Amycolatopsis sp. MtRt-6]|uniref:FtsK/SpoIIIE domain-containing protein n=1 Tax=Amycolatopsis sp. MtRt-6 TaxID=2792782 RepID=UPI001A8DF5BA|nr:zonular occludens toxin domain-containing protein [Amycolatopsis sp. MtRt-6]